MLPEPDVAVAAPTAGQVRSAVRGTYVAFAGSGFAFASWASRIPQVRDHLHLSPSGLGLVLFAIAAGSILALPLAGAVVHRLGSRRAVASMTVPLSVGLAVVAVGYLIGTPVVVVGLFLLGFANGTWDVAMNVQGAIVERHLGRSIMARFHAGWSLGTVTGALVGAAMVALHVPVAAHLLVVAVGTCLGVTRGTRAFVHDAAGVTASDTPGGTRSALAAWREPRTLLIGVLTLAFAFAEGTGNDWISVAAISGYGVPATVGTLAFAVFLTAMTVGRWFGPPLLDRYGRVPVVRALAALAVAGVSLFVFAPSAPLAFVGALLWGAGTSLGFPVGMSAGADNPKYAAGRVSVIASIGYCAFLGGPPLIGFLGDRITVLRALVAVAVLLAIAAVVSGAVARPTDPAAVAGTAPEEAA